MGIFGRLRIFRGGDDWEAALGQEVSISGGGDIWEAVLAW